MCEIMLELDLDKINENTLSDSIQSLLLPFLEDKKHTILLVDDEENNLQFLKRTLRSQYSILTAQNGEEALDVIAKHNDEISLVVSDQRMPNMQGTEFMKILTAKNPNIIKILLTGYSDTDTIVEAINDCHLYQYILKPIDPETLTEAVSAGIQKFDLSNNKATALRDLKELFYKTIKSISSALDAKDPYTHGHSQRVTLYSLILANELNLPSVQMESIEIASLLHDIGKIGIPESILCKPGRLTNEEFEIMKLHPERGEQMILKISKLKTISDWLKNHHEKWDGTGYPSKLKGEDIPLVARIIAIADTYDAMTSTRSYRVALTHEIAIEEIKKCAGTQFDPELAEKFVAIQEKIKFAQQHPEEEYLKYSYLLKNSL